MEQTVKAVGAHLSEGFEYLQMRPESAYQRSVLRRYLEGTLTIHRGGYI